MSGLEVVGVVLGGIPLIISALEQYAKGVETMNNMRHYQTVFLDIQRELTTASGLLRQTFEEVLRGIHIPDAQYRDLVEYHEGWGDKDLILKLQDKLMNDFDIFLRSTARLSERIKILARKLGLVAQTLKPQFEKGGSIDEKRRTKFLKMLALKPAWVGIMFGFGAKEQTKLVEKITTDVSRLNHLALKAIDLREERRERSSSSTSRYWLALRDHTDRLYHALQSILTRKCPAHRHVVTLQLDFPKDAATHIGCAQFDISFFRNEELNGPSWGARNATVLSLKAPSFPKTEVTNEHNKVRKRVGFLSELPPNAVGKQSTCVSTKLIDDLCLSLEQCGQKTECLGIMPQKEWHYHVHNVRAHIKPPKLVPLREVLNSRALKPKERCIWALSLATAVLQLYDTPWLKDDWTLKDVYTHSGGSFQLFIAPSLDHSSNDLQSICSSKQQTSLIRNLAIFALGVALLELSYGTDISCFQTSSDLDNNQCEHALTRFMIADRLTKEVQKTESSRFAEAVGKCICPASDKYDFSLSSEGFRRKFYEDVVMRLKEEHDYLFGDTTPKYSY